MLSANRHNLDWRLPEQHFTKLLSNIGVTRKKCVWCNPKHFVRTLVSTDRLITRCLFESDILGGLQGK